MLNVKAVLMTFIVSVVNGIPWDDTEYGSTSPYYRSEQGRNSNYGSGAYGDDFAGLAAPSRHSYSHLPDYSTAHLHGPPYPDDYQTAADESYSRGQRVQSSSSKGWGAPQRRPQSSSKGWGSPPKPQSNSKGWGRGEPDKVVVEHHYYSHKPKRQKQKQSSFPRLKFTPFGVKLIPFRVKVQKPKLKFRSPSLKLVY